MAEKEFTLRVVTPERIFYEGTATMVEFNTTEDQIGVYPGHIPLTVIVSPGVLRIHEPEGERDAALHAGFAEILPDGISILAEVVEWPEEIDLQRAEEAVARAKGRIDRRDANTDLARAQTALQRAMARINVLK